MKNSIKNAKWYLQGLAFSKEQIDIYAPYMVSYAKEVNGTDKEVKKEELEEEEQKRAICRIIQNWCKLHEIHFSIPFIEKDIDIVFRNIYQPK